MSCEKLKMTPPGKKRAQERPLHLHFRLWIRNQGVLDSIQFFHSFEQPLKYSLKSESNSPRPFVRFAVIGHGLPSVGNKSTSFWSRRLEREAWPSGSAFWTKPVPVMKSCAAKSSLCSPPMSRREVALSSPALGRSEPQTSGFAAEFDGTESSVTTRSSLVSARAGWESSTRRAIPASGPLRCHQGASSRTGSRSGSQEAI